MKKILVLHRYPPKQVVGTNASFIEFLKKLSKEGFQTFYLTYKEKDHDSIQEEIENLSYIYLPLTFNRGKNLDKTIKTYLWILLAPIYVTILQKKYDIDIVYCDDSVPYYGFLSKLLSPKSKVVIRLGDLQTGYALADSSPSLFKFVLSVEKFMWRKVDGIIAISKPFKNFLVKQGIRDKKISVVKESINLDGVSLTEVDVPNSGIVSFHGSIVKCKGLETLVDAFSIFNRNFPETKLMIAGGGGKEAAIKQYVKDNKVAGVEFSGWYDHKKLSDFMENVQIAVVMRSKNMANNFVVTTCLLENWKFKKPVLVPNLEAFRKTIKDGENGIFFEASDAEDLAKKLEQLYKHNDYNKLVQGGLKTAEEGFNHRTIAANMVNALKKY